MNGGNIEKSLREEVFVSGDEEGPSDILDSFNPDEMFEMLSWYDNEEEETLSLSKTLQDVKNDERSYKSMSSRRSRRSSRRSTRRRSRKRSRSSRQCAEEAHELRRSSTSRKMRRVSYPHEIRTRRRSSGKSRNDECDVYSINDADDEASQNYVSTTAESDYECDNSTIISGNDEPSPRLYQPSLQQQGLTNVATATATASASTFSCADDLLSSDVLNQLYVTTLHNFALSMKRSALSRRKVLLYGVEL